MRVSTLVMHTENYDHIPKISLILYQVEHMPIQCLLCLIYAKRTLAKEYFI